MTHRSSAVLAAVLPAVLPAVLALGLGLSACATPTTYGPAGPRQGVGFSDYRIEAGRYRVIFQGGPGAPPEVVADLALRRAAEITLADGYDWFRVIDRMTDRSAGRSGATIGIGGGSGGYRSGIGVGVGTSIDLSGGPAWRQSLEILAGKGPRPEGAYDARDMAR
jgi:hypothetical protein